MVAILARVQRHVLLQTALRHEDLVAELALVAAGALVDDGHVLLIVAAVPVLVVTDLAGEARLVHVRVLDMPPTVPLVGVDAVAELTLVADGLARLLRPVDEVLRLDVVVAVHREDLDVLLVRAVCVEAVTAVRVVQVAVRGAHVGVRVVQLVQDVCVKARLVQDLSLQLFNHLLLLQVENQVGRVVVAVLLGGQLVGDRVGGLFDGHLLARRLVLLFQLAGDTVQRHFEHGLGVVWSLLHVAIFQLSSFLCQDTWVKCIYELKLRL